jgi:hypothetical protein
MAQWLLATVRLHIPYGHFDCTGLISILPDRSRYQVIVFGLPPSRTTPITYHTRNEHANYYTTHAAWKEYRGIYHVYISLTIIIIVYSDPMSRGTRYIESNTGKSARQGNLRQPRVRFQSFADSASLVSERLKSYPRVSEISLSCTFCRCLILFLTFISCF